MKTQRVGAMAMYALCYSNLPRTASHAQLQDIRRKAESLVRLALFCEQKRIPLKRDEISKKGTLQYLRHSDRS